MDDKKSEQKNKVGSEMDLTASDLKGKQSVRATFTLSSQVIELLSIVAAQLGIKQKSLFDQLVEDSEVLDLVAQDAQQYSTKKKDRRKKTFVISRNSLLSLDFVARDRQMPRDILVEFSIQRLLPVISAELEKHHKRILLLQDMESYLKKGKNILQKAGNLLGEGDKVYELIEKLVNLCEEDVSDIKEIVEKGKCMENYYNQG